MKASSTSRDAGPADDRRREPEGWGARALRFGEAYALVGLTLALILFFSLLPASSDTFATMANLKLVLAGQAVLLAVSLAVILPMVANVWDFAPGATAGMAAIFGASAVASSGSIPLMIFVAVCVGLVVGLASAVLVTVLKINSVIATFGVTIFIQGIVQWKTKGNSIVEGIPTGLTDFGGSDFLGVPLLAWSAIALALIVYYVLRQTPYGRYLYAIGSNRDAAKLVGIRVHLLTGSAFVFGGAIAGIAGILLLARTGAGNPTVGPGLTLPAYAALFLGASAITPGRANVGGLVVAILFLGVLNSGLSLAGASLYVNTIANGLALLAGIGLANLMAKRRGATLTLS